MAKRAFIVWIFVSHLHYHLIAQSAATIDSVVALNQKSWDYQNRGNYDSSIYFALQAAGRSNQSNLFEQMATAYQYIGESYMRLHARDSALKYLDKALETAKQNNLREFEAGVYNSLANVDLNSNRYESALTNFIRSAHIYDSVDNKVGLSKALSNIGNIEYRLDHLDKAIQYTMQSKNLALANDYVAGLGYTHKLLGWIYRKKGLVDDALSQYDSALRIYERLGSQRDIAEITLSIGNAYFDKTNYDLAINYYTRSINASKSINYGPFLPYAYSGLAFANHALKHNTKALSYADSMEVVSRSININLMLDAYNLKSSIWEDMANYEKALHYQKKFQILSDSLTSAENRQAIEETEAKYQNDLKQREIDQLKQENNLRESKAQIIWAAAAGALTLVIVITILLVNRFIIVNRSARLLEIERMRNSIARDLHDDIGSALSSISIMSKVGSQNTQPEVAQQNFKRIGDQSSKLMESMSDIVWSINPENDSAEKLMSKMREFAVEILEPVNVLVDFQVRAGLSLTIDASQRKNLFLIFKEAINNAAKYSNCKRVQVLISAGGKQLTLSIKDDGVGFEVDQVKRRNGLNNMTQRANNMNADFQISSQVGEGTAITLTINTT